MLTNERKSLGGLLVEAELITQDQLNEALTLQKSSGKKLGEVLLEMGAVSERKILEVLEFQLQVPLVDHLQNLAYKLGLFKHQDH